MGVDNLKHWDCECLNNPNGGVATLLGGVNTQIFKVNCKNLFLFFLMVFYYCNVGESMLKLKASGQLSIIISQAKLVIKTNTHG